MSDPNWTKDLSWSSKAFLELVWPVLSQRIPGELVPVETNTKDHLAHAFDMLSGIDAWHIVNGTGIKGIASRVQDGESWETFTIRKSRNSGTKTEYQKRKEAIETGEWLYPYWTVQSYITDRNNGELLSFALTKTERLINMITQWEEAGQPLDMYRNGLPYSVIGIRATGNADFYWLSWSIDGLVEHEYIRDN